VGRAQDLSLDHMFQIRTAEGQHGQAQRVAGAWTASRHGGKQTVSLAGGVEWFERLDGVDGALTSPWGEVTLSARRSRSSVSLAYEHAIVPSYESLSDRIADTVSLAWTANLGRRVTSTMATSFSSRRDPDLRGSPDNMARASVGLSYLAQSGLELATRYAFESRRRSEAEPRASRHRVEVDLGFGRVWH
jgi:hypothetical protein